MTGPQDRAFVLAFYPTTHGYAFVLSEGPDAPFDWGVREIRGDDKNSATVEALKKLIATYHPEAIVIEDAAHGPCRRASRIKNLYKRIEHVAAAEGIEVHRYTRADVREVFEETGAITKHELAVAIAEMIPAFAHRLPRKRKIWMSEDPRQSLFDAAALGLTHFDRTQGYGNDIRAQ